MSESQPAPSTSSSTSLSIQLQIGNSKASINGTVKALDVPPMIVNGRTMVPLHFISEALGADVKWYGKERKVSINYGSSYICLWIDDTNALINEKKVKMDVPAKIIKGRTMVPIAFISKSFDKDVTYVPDTKTVLIKDKTATATSTLETEKTDITFLYGKWKLWNPGGISYTTDGVSTYQQYVSGVGGQTLEIRSDGTYTWKLYDEVVKDKWKRDGDTILLPKGDYGWEWHVKEYDFDDGKGIKVYTLGTWRDGKRIK